MRRYFLAVMVTLAVVQWSVDGKGARSDAARRAFVKAVACPSTLSHSLPCPGYIIDHIMPLCAGGADDPSNMEWQTVENAKKKDVLEMRACTCFKKHS